MAILPSLAIAPPNAVAMPEGIPVAEEYKSTPDDAARALNDLTDQWFGCIRLYSEKYAKLNEPAETLATAVLTDCATIQQMREKAVDYSFQLAGASPYGTYGPKIAELKRYTYEKGRSEAIGHIIRARAKMAK